MHTKFNGKKYCFKDAELSDNVQIKVNSGWKLGVGLSFVCLHPRLQKAWFSLKKEKQGGKKAK